ncbi:hypothetical protein NMG60_11032406 [Bertholletia excelsa]
MVPKRPFSDREDDDVASKAPIPDSKRRLTFATVVRDVMKGLSAHEFLTMFEPFLRTVVREEVERAIFLHCHPPRPSLNQLESSQARAWLLHFDTKLPPTLFTGSRIESEDNEPIKIVILDANSKNIITSGPLSSIKIEIVVLDGDFGSDDQEDWTEKEFNKHVVREREGKRPLVTGELVITLREGVGFIGDISFTDNSSWIRSRKFRLGARTHRSISTDVRIREARSAAFVVKDHRGESYRKHHPPNLDDDIWRLEKIAKDGAFHKKLAAGGIYTVKDLLRSFNVDHSSLRNVFGAIPNKTWETIIEHATTCVLDDKLYAYFGESEGVGLVFNSVFRIVGAMFDSQIVSLDKLTLYQMRMVENLKKCAYNNLNALVPIEEPAVLGLAMSLSSPAADFFGSPSIAPQPANLPQMHQDQTVMQMASCHMTTTPYNHDMGDGCQLLDFGTQHGNLMPSFAQMSRNTLIATDCFSRPYGGENNWAFSGHDENLLSDASNFQGQGLFFPPSNQKLGIVSSDFGMHISSNGKSKARWCVIWAVMKCGISVRRDVAAKKSRLFLPAFSDYTF